MAEGQIEQVEGEMEDQLLAKLDSMKVEAEEQLAAIKKSKESLEAFL